MGYYSGNVSISTIAETEHGVIVSAVTQHTDKTVQCYVSGDLIAWRRPDGGAVQFTLPQVRPNDAILLLAVDNSDESTDFWPQAFESNSVYGNRVQVDFRLDFADGRQPGDKWRVYRGNAGDAEATIVIHEAEVFPGGRGSMGWGFAWGRDGWGYGGANAPGWGRHWGYSWGFGTAFQRFVSEPLTRGAYRIKTEVEDQHENVSTTSESTVTIDTCARPAGDLAVSSYDKVTDTLVLTQTASEDIT